VEARYAEVVVNTSLRRGPRAIRRSEEAPSRDAVEALGRAFHYTIPEPLLGRLEVGHMVRVPFGRRVLEGIVVALADSSPVVETRNIEALLDPHPVLSPAQIELARWMSSQYLAPLRSCLQQMLPPGLSRQAQLLVERVEPISPPGDQDARRPDQEAEGTGDHPELSAIQTALLCCLEKRSPQEWRALGQAVGQPDWEEALEELIWQGLAAKRWTLAAPRVRAKRRRFLELIADEATATLALSSLGRPSKQADVLEVLAASDDPLPTMESVCQRAGCLSQSVRVLEKKGWVDIVPARRLVAISRPSSRIETALATELSRAPKQANVLRYLLREGGPVEVARLRRDVPSSLSALRALEGRGLIRRWMQGARVLLQLGVAQIGEILLSLRGVTRHAAILCYLQETGSAPIEEVYRETGARLDHVRELMDRDLVCMEEREVWRDPLAGQEFVLTAPPRLTPEQESTWREILRGLRGLFQGERADRGPAPPAYLLHGVTGSGKTELYLHALQETLAAGQQAIVLVPEIALTPQTIRRFAARFPNRIAVLHSGLSPGERYDSWRRIRAGRADVVIGPRSAVFAPLPRLGCIVLDEEHETAYKQESTPRYHARDVALQRAQLEQAVVILGSATPDLGTFYWSLRDRLTLLRLPRRVMGHRAKVEEQRARHAIEPARLRLRGAGPGYEELRYLDLPPVEIVDLREELRAGNRSIFSRALQSALAETLEHRQQAILFLNRRGAATFVLCRDCGLALSCRRCDVPLTYHADSQAGIRPRTSRSGRLVCHHCGRQEQVPKTCPRCGGHRIRYFGVGTQRVAEVLHGLFPSVRSLRWDRDATKGTTSHEALLEQLVNHQADVLVGTQMVAKGLDLPLVTLVGVISADTALHLPDFRAGERTFQLLTQVAGRAGRSILGGRVIIQTYSPHHYAIQAASRHDYRSFYEQEIAFRREQGYPPFTRLARLVYRHRDEDRCMAEVQRLAELLRLEARRHGAGDVSLIGPAPCFFARLQGRYRWQIVLRAPDPAVLLRPIELPLGWQLDIDPVEVL
jgi:primosomal protein N' (replication factor Y)